MRNILINQRVFYWPFETRGW